MLDSNIKYDVSVILINYNSGDLTNICVNSIIEKTAGDINYNVVVVDNCSEESEFVKIKHLAEIDNVKVVRSKINLGFSGGHMYGLQFTTAKYYFFLNNDCQFLNDCISELYRFCENNEKVGLCSPQMYNAENMPVPCVDYFPVISSKFLGTGIFKILKGKDYFNRKKIYDHPVKVDVISGSQMFARATAFNKIGGLDTNYFLYCEEEDLALRMYNNNYDVYLLPDAKNIHHGGASSPATYGIRKEFYISFLYFYRKHYGFLKTEIFKFILFLRIIRKAYKRKNNLSLSFFVLSGAHMKHSLRHQQKIVELD